MSTSDRPIMMLSGGNRGIGYCIAQAAQARGWHVSLGLRDPSVLPHGLDPQLTDLHAYDATSRSAEAKWVDATVARHGRIDTIVANAASPKRHGRCCGPAEAGGWRSSDHCLVNVWRQKALRCTRSANSPPLVWPMLCALRAGTMASARRPSVRALSRQKWAPPRRATPLQQKR